jgi:transcriptional regulator with XRE-family HTH domain
MTRFEEQLLRLKQCLGMTKDSQVAAALGMSKAAFSNRKHSGSFPEEKVVALKRSRPDLDVMYVLTGHRRATIGVIEGTIAAAGGARNDDALVASAFRAAAKHFKALQDAADDPQVRELLGILVWCDREAIARIVRFAAKQMGPDMLLFDEREPARHQLLSADVPHRD